MAHVFIVPPHLDRRVVDFVGLSAPVLDGLPAGRLRELLLGRVAEHLHAKWVEIGCVARVLLSEVDEVLCLKAFPLLLGGTQRGVVVTRAGGHLMGVSPHSERFARPADRPATSGLRMRLQLRLWLRCEVGNRIFSEVRRRRSHGVDLLLNVDDGLRGLEGGLVVHLDRVLRRGWRVDRFGGFELLRDKAVLVRRRWVVCGVRMDRMEITHQFLLEQGVLALLGVNTLTRRLHGDGVESTRSKISLVH